MPVNTIAFGTPDGTVTVQGQQHPVPADPQAMAKIAQDTGGQTFDAETADQLTQTYSKIAATIGYDTADSTRSRCGSPPSASWPPGWPPSPPSCGARD